MFLGSQRSAGLLGCIDLKSAEPSFIKQNLVNIKYDLPLGLYTVLIIHRKPHIKTTTISVTPFSSKKNVHNKYSLLPNYIIRSVNLPCICKGCILLKFSSFIAENYANQWALFYSFIVSFLPPLYSYFPF